MPFAGSWVMKLLLHFPVWQKIVTTKPTFRRVFKKKKKREQTLKLGDTDKNVSKPLWLSLKNSHIFLFFTANSFFFCESCQIKANKVGNTAKGATVNASGGVNYQHCVSQHVFKVRGPVEEPHRWRERERTSAALLMKDGIRPLTSHLLQGQWRRSGQGATLEYLAAHPALLLLIFADGGVVHHGEMRVLAISQTWENVLKDSGGGQMRRFCCLLVQLSVSSPTDISQCSDSTG